MANAPHIYPRRPNRPVDRGAPGTRLETAAKSLHRYLPRTLDSPVSRGAKSRVAQDRLVHPGVVATREIGRQTFWVFRSLEFGDNIHHLRMLIERRPDTVWRNHLFNLFVVPYAGRCSLLGSAHTTSIVVP
jgi:hypothetical protein